MVATQSFSISRRALDVEDYIDIGRRHVGWIVGPTFFGLVASICLAFMLPNEYTSKATMQITPPQIGTNMVQSTIANPLNERVQQMVTQIESRSELSSIINDPRLLLYKDELKTKPLDDVIEDMKNAISINFVSAPGSVNRGAAAFDISFSYKDRFRAQQTVESLMTKFQEQNQNTQKGEQDATSGLVGDLLQQAKADMAEASDKLTAFKEGNQGKLPEQLQLNMARQGSYTAKIQSDDEQIFRDQQRLTQLDTEKAQTKAQLDYYIQELAEIQTINTAQGTLATPENKELAVLDANIENAQYYLLDLKKRFADSYPSVKAVKMQLESLQTRRDDLKKKLDAKAAAEASQAAADAASKTDTSKTLAGLRERDIRRGVDEKVAALDNQEALINQEVDKMKKEQEVYKKESADIDQLLKDSTGLEGQYEELRQNKAMAEAKYEEYERKNQVADASGKMIERKAGELLDVLDTANLPTTPTKPHRYTLVGGGFALSIVLGLAMAGLQEAKDTSLKNLKDVRAYTNLPVLCSIPLLENTMLVKRKRRLTYLAWAAAVLVGAAAVSASLVYYYTQTAKTI
jgi:capsular polysaccharide biosynthesis protein